ncbi:MAG: hypothetical protein HOH43_06560, partial [Candidatus Latescibacteria bacterium]|nr:hypothetical protein [Candidatus Latescibacterota bacterium]
MRFWQNKNKALLIVICVFAAPIWPLQAQEVPDYKVDPFWPKVPLPNAWLIQGVPTMTTDNRDHVWAISRSADLRPDESMATYDPPRGDCCVAAPDILEFDTQGN